MTRDDIVSGVVPEGAPTTFRTRIGMWLRRSLFSSIWSGILTVLAVGLLCLTIPPLVDWAILSAVWTGTDQKACKEVEGACWVFVRVWWEFLMYGHYPREDLWRIHVVYFIGAVGLIALMWPGVPRKPWIGTMMLTVFPVCAYVMFVGGSFGLERVHTSLWGGLFLTLVIGTVGILLSLPLGIFLALGRRSHLLVIRTFCVAFIELWRGVPLITVLFMASIMFPLFLPEGLNFDKLARALIGVALFSSAYVAEVVRGGLQAIPVGQYEAARAFGLGYWRMMGLVILPQALKIVIPGIVNTFIGLFKDSTLVLIVGLLDLLGTAKAALSNPAWISFSTEAYVFTAFCFWIFCFSMSRYSHSLEKRLGADRR